MKTITILVFLLLATDTMANALSAKFHSWQLSRNDAFTLNVILQKASRKGNFQKIIKLMQRASQYGVVFHHHNFETMLQNVAASGNPDAINLAVKLADKRCHTYYFSNTFGCMFYNVAASGNPDAIDLVVKLTEARDLRLSADDFILAMASAAEEGKTWAIGDVFDMATNRGFKLGTDDFSDAAIEELLSSTAKSGDPETISMVTTLADEHNVKIADKHFGETLAYATRRSYQKTRKVLKLVSARDVSIDHNYFVMALEHAAEKYLSIRAKMEHLLEFADERGITITADDFGRAMARAAGNHNLKGVRVAIKVATERGLIINRQHFVAAMQAKVGTGLYLGLNTTAEIASAYNIQLNAEDFVAVMLSAIHNLRLNALPRIDKLAIQYGAKLEKKHFSQLLKKAAERIASIELDNEEISNKPLEAVIELGNSYGLEVDAEFFDTAVGYLDKDSVLYTRAIRRLDEIARGYGIKLDAAKDL